MPTAEAVISRRGMCEYHVHFLSRFRVADRNATIEVPKSKVLAVFGPGKRQNLGGDTVFSNRLLLGMPHSQICCRSTCQLLRHWIEGKALYAFLVRVLHQSLKLRSPDNDRLVRSSRSDQRSI